MKFNQSVNRFRALRGQRLQEHIAGLSATLGRKVHILDIGGREDYWENLQLDNIEHITLINLESSEFELYQSNNIDNSIFTNSFGDGRNLNNYDDKSIDFVHSNSVIEHVGNWENMLQMAHELVRVGRAGWVQTPAWEFPIEPHFHVPLMHWFGRPIARQMLNLSHFPYYRKSNIHDKRLFLENINLVSRSEFRFLFPSADLFTERFFLLPKSYIALWSDPKT